MDTEEKANVVIISLEYRRLPNTTAAEVLPSVGKFIKLLPNSQIGPRKPSSIALLLY